MTPKERTIKILEMRWRSDPDPYSPGRREYLLREELEQRIEQAITAAIEDEREACAKLCDEAVEKTPGHDRLGRYGRNLANHIGKRIRARSYSSVEEAANAVFADEDFQRAVREPLMPKAR